MSYISSVSARSADPSVPSIKTKGLSSCIKLNQVGGVESLTRGQIKVHSASSMLRAKNNSTAIPTSYLDYMLLVFLNNKCYLFPLQ